MTNNMLILLISELFIGLIAIIGYLLYVVSKNNKPKGKFGEKLYEIDDSFPSIPEYEKVEKNDNRVDGSIFDTRHEEGWSTSVGVFT